MSQYFAFNSQKRKRILWHSIVNYKAITVIAVLPVASGILIALLKWLLGAVEKSFVFDEPFTTKTLIILVMVVCLSIVVWIAFYLFARFVLRHKLDRLHRRIPWEQINIGRSRIYMSVDSQEFYIEQDSIRRIFFATENDKKLMVDELWQNKVKLDVLILATSNYYLCIALELIENSQDMLKDLNDIFPIDGYDFDREEDIE